MQIVTASGKVNNEAAAKSENLPPTDYARPGKSESQSWSGVALGEGLSTLHYLVGL
jgi:hypothetical protein